MFAIIIKGENKVVDWVTEPKYIRFSKKSNRYVKTRKERAEGISADNGRYILNLPGKNIIEGKPEAIIADRGDIGPILFKNQNNINDIRKENQLTQDALIEQDEIVEDRLSIIEDAILELDSKNNKEE